MAPSSDGDHVIGWSLDPEERRRLLERFPPRYPDVIADHVTLASKVGRDAPLPTEGGGEIIGRIDDEAGLQALIVAIGGTPARPDGGTYHISWSLDRSRGRQPVESNDVIARLGWHPLPAPVPIRLIPARWPRS